MTFRETLRIALAGVTANKMRSALTIVGMTIGVAAVIVLVAVGNGSKQQVQAGIQALGTNVLLVQGAGARGGPGAFGASSATLTTADATALGNAFDAPDVKSVAPVVNAQGSTLVAGSLTYSPGQMLGTTAAYLSARNYDVAEGTGITSADVSKHNHVVVIGPTVVANLLPGVDPVGQTIRINGTTFTVAGVTKAKGATGVQDQDDVVIAPITAIQDSITGYGSVNQIIVQARSQSGLASAQAEVTSILSNRLHVTDPTNLPFQVINQGSILATSDQATSVFTTLLGAVAAISLLVGGIGVMNIMLVSVTERTREIGIRKAIGARRADILTQFLTEAVLVSVFGGVLGVAVGLAGSRLRIAGVNPSVVPSSVALAFGAAVLAGLFFGTYPAGRAARMRPVDALRFE